MQSETQWTFRSPQSNSLPDSRISPAQDPLILALRIPQKRRVTQTLLFSTRHIQRPWLALLLRRRVSLNKHGWWNWQERLRDAHMNRKLQRQTVMVPAMDFGWVEKRNLLHQLTNNSSCVFFLEWYHLFCCMKSSALCIFPRDERRSSVSNVYEPADIPFFNVLWEFLVPWIGTRGVEDNGWEGGMGWDFLGMLLMGRMEGGNSKSEIPNRRGMKDKGLV